MKFKRFNTMALLVAITFSISVIASTSIYGNEISTFPFDEDTMEVSTESSVDQFTSSFSNEDTVDDLIDLDTAVQNGQEFTDSLYNDEALGSTAGASKTLREYMKESVEYQEEEIIDNQKEIVEEDVVIIEEPEPEPDPYKLKPYDESKSYYISAESGINVRSFPDVEDSTNKVAALEYNEQVEVLGKVKVDEDSDEKYEKSEFVYIGSEENPLFISGEYLSEEEMPELEKQSVPYEWDGPKLAKGIGTVMGPSGKETYYNMPMSGVIKIMRSIGNYDEYWIREDGCKMLGQYIMVAADLSIRPRGSHVPTSLGMGVVCDTGEFIYTNQKQLDLAVDWV